MRRKIVHLSELYNYAEALNGWFPKAFLGVEVIERALRVNL